MATPPSNSALPKPARAGVNAVDIPVLQTQRLQLRAFKITDLPEACDLWGNEEVVRFIGGAIRERPSVWEAMARTFGHWALLGYGFWAITERDNDIYIGEIGYLQGLRTLQPPHDEAWLDTPEAGWALARHAWGKGYASEALAAVNNWADVALSASHTLCLIHPEHSASLRVAEKNGYTPIREATLGNEPTRVLARARVK